MSQTYSIGCRQCRKHLWIAQSSQGNPSLYTGEPHTMAALKVFLFEHLGHSLEFNENTCTDLAEWDEIEIDPEPSSPPA